MGQSVIRGDGAVFPKVAPLALASYMVVLFQTVILREVKLDPGVPTCWPGGGEGLGED